MRHIDYETQAISMGNLLSPFMYKRKSFEHERELRALIWTPQHGKNDVVNPGASKYKDTLGLSVLINLEVLIERIYVAPTAPPWILELLRSLLNKYNLSKDVVQSSLSSVPID